jgi:hypothetical protein
MSNDNSPVLERELPSDVLRRIIHFSLVLPSVIPEDVSQVDDLACTQWNDLAGHRGRRVDVERVLERKQMQRRAIDLMLVCRDWKVRPASLALSRVL